MITNPGVGPGLQHKIITSAGDIYFDLCLDMERDVLKQNDDRKCLNNDNTMALTIIYFATTLFIVPEPPSSHCAE